MLKIPLYQLTDNISSIFSYINKDVKFVCGLNEQEELNELNILNIRLDNKLHAYKNTNIRSPLAACLIECEVINRFHISRKTYVCLIDLLGVKLIGTPLEVRVILIFMTGVFLMKV